ncbi:DUF551 domain-containing protein [Zavarzinella formosa]|uniref:hypothetical protein n=1 Tax=Zavarzinella formosa TaxID=360055 RepID=UPI0012F7B685|nr:hypothetical protein [Zavarzinella formosa]
MDFAEEKYLSVFTQFDWKMWQAAWNTRTSPPSSINQSWWRAIESAPKDGDWVLLTGFSPQLATGERWHATGSYEHGKWSNGYVYLHPPTHWMPLPLPPSEEHGGVGERLAKMRYDYSADEINEAFAKNQKAFRCGFDEAIRQCQEIFCTPASSVLEVLDRPEMIMVAAKAMFPIIDTVSNSSLPSATITVSVECAAEAAIAAIKKQMKCGNA